MQIPHFFRRPATATLTLICIGFAGLQFVRPDLPDAPATAEPDVPVAVRGILKRSCYDCHSGQTNLRWFDQIAPASWLVASHVKKGRAALDFSRWDSLAPKARTATLYHALNLVLYREMPLPAYTLLHPGARLSTEDVDTLKRYLRSLTPVKATDSSVYRALEVFRRDKTDGETEEPEKKKLSRVAPSPNGIAYIRGYRNWQVLSTTDRFDNGTMRIIYGNDVAVRAVRSGHINPWPDGTIFAKVLFKEVIDSSLQVTPGEFIHAEFMIKDARKYAATKGWGWARWVGPGLKPYGSSAVFSTECTDCHQPMKKNDFVFTMPLALKAD